jgi:hypothetical protein
MMNHLYFSRINTIYRLQQLLCIPGHSDNFKFLEINEFDTTMELSILTFLPIFISFQSMLPSILLFSPILTLFPITELHITAFAPIETLLPIYTGVMIFLVFSIACCSLSPCFTKNPLLE